MSCDLVHEIGDRQLQLMRPEPAGFGGRGEVVTRPEIEEDIGGLADQQLPRSQKRRGEGRMLDLLAVEQAQHRTLATRFPGDIDIVGPGLLQRQANKLATPLNRRPSSRARTACRYS